jgi:hypothetical protein
MYRIFAYVVLFAALVGACNNGGLTVPQYAIEVATLVQDLDSRLDAKAEEYVSASPSVDGLREYLGVRVTGYRDAVEGLDAIEPPEAVVDLHATFKEIMSNLLIAEVARAAFADSIDSVEEITAVWEGPESQAVRRAEEDAVVLCYAAQERLDETAEGAEALSDVPWMPTEMKSAVRVFLDCP